MSERRFILVLGNDGRGPYTSAELREEVDLIAKGKPWGWRATVIGAEAVCDGSVIAEAMEAA